MRRRTIRRARISQVKTNASGDRLFHRLPWVLRYNAMSHIGARCRQGRMAMNAKVPGELNYALSSPLKTFPFSDVP